MRLTIIGCSGSYPGPESPASAYLLSAEDGHGKTWKLLVDFGSGALGALQRYIDPLTVDGVLLSHLHPDHCADLCGYYVLRRYHPDGHAPVLPVWAPEHADRRLAEAYGMGPGEDMSGEFDFRVLDGEFEFGPFRITPVPVAHPVPAFGFRIRANGRTLAYTGDTGPCPQLDDLAAGADVLLAEASFRDRDTNPPDLHLTASQAVEVAQRAGVRRVVLTHIPAWFDREDIMADAARPEFGGTVALAAQGAIYAI